MRNNLKDVNGDVFREALVHHGTNLIAGFKYLRENGIYLDDGSMPLSYRLSASNSSVQDKFQQLLSHQSFKQDCDNEEASNIVRRYHVNIFISLYEHYHNIALYEVFVGSVETFHEIPTNYSNFRITNKKKSLYIKCINEKNVTQFSLETYGNRIRTWNLLHRKAGNLQFADTNSLLLACYLIAFLDNLVASKSASNTKKDDIDYFIDGYLKDEKLSTETSA